jgi:hypothetical protein
MIQKLFNPFIQIAGAKSVIIGLLFVILSATLAAFFNTRFDGVLDAHYTKDQSFYISYLDNLINIGVVTFVFYGFGAILTKGRTRFVDILGTTMLSRFPLFIITLFNIQNQSGIIGEKIIQSITKPNAIQLTKFEWIYLITSGIISLLLIIWFIVLLFKAYKISTNLKGANLIVSFILGIIIAEILSKIIIYQL